LTSRGRLRAAVSRATALLRAAEIDAPEVTALRLAEHVAGVRPVLTADALPDDFEARYFRLVGQRAAHVPLQLLTGRAPFRYLELAVAPDVFIPRPETELVAGAAIDAARQVAAAVVVDLGTGAGPIALALADEVPGARVIAVDLSPAAAELTRRNAAELGRTLDVRLGDLADESLLADVAGAVDVVVSNPPYLPAGLQLPAEVVEHDPPAALWGGGPAGLELPGAVVAAAHRLLRPGGWLVLEHDETQAAAVRALASGFTELTTHRDLTDRDRYLTARR
jgi:release factor glutamine methyltransferase